MKNLYLAVIVTLTCTAYAIGASLSITDGVVESQTGGFKFPDGTVQTSAAFPAASTCTAITYVPYIISAEGVYCFTGNLSYSITTDEAIIINADNVTINMNGWQLDGLSAGTATYARGIYAFHRKNINIRNGTVRGFYIGIFLDASDFAISQGHLVEDIRADRNTYIGIDLRGRGSIVRQNQVVATGGSIVTDDAAGILLRGHGGRVLNNDINATVATFTGLSYGLYVHDVDGAVIEGNRINDVNSPYNTSVAVEIAGSSDVLSVGNRITNADLGILYSNGSTGKYMDNLTSSVTTAFTGGIAVGTNNS